MAALWGAVTEYYYNVLEEKGDPRVKDWPMMSSPIPTILICIFYAYFVRVIGPKLMENRKPFDLQRLMIYYNLFQVILSAWILYGGLKNGWWNDYSLTCQPVDFSDEPKAVRMAAVCWWYYMSKFTEFFDTFLFVLRKKNKHISVLHVIHHGLMPFSTWFGVKFTAGGHLTLFGVINSLVHVIMYGYYLLAALGPQMRPYLWWKKYLTFLQIIQFVIVMLHASQLFFFDCNHSKVFAWWIVMQAFVFLYLFRNFYIQSYIKKQKVADSSTDKMSRKLQ